MTAPPVRLDLAAEFPQPSAQQWRALVRSVLDRAGTSVTDDDAPEQALSFTNDDGITIAPLYTADSAGHADPGLPGQPPFVRGATAQAAVRTGWDVRQLVSEPDPDAANAAALTELGNGATSLWLRIGDGAIAVGDLAQVLDGVYLDLAPVVLDAGADTIAAATELLRLAADRGVAADELRGGLGADPIGLAARTGEPARLAMLADAVELAAGHRSLCPIAVDATVYHDAGGSDSDELAISLAVGVGYLRALAEHGHSIDDSLRLLEFRYAVTADQFASIAKLRAARRVWDRVAELSGAGDDRRGQRQHAVTSAAMMTRRDPWVNMLRTTIGCFAAAVGGAEAITVAPFDSAIGLPEDFGRRIARNTQSVLHDEASLARVVDPAGGSWYVESLTEALAERAWQKFTELERCGGAVAALQSGEIEKMLAATRQTRSDRLAHRAQPLTGVSEFAPAAEQPLRRRPAPAPPSGGLPTLRYAEPFEALAARSAAHAERTGSRPRVLLAALGTPKASAGRLAFASNLLQIADIEAVVAGPDGLVEAMREAGTEVVLLCSSDAVYGEQAQQVATDLKAAGAAQVWIAGPAKLATGAVDGSIQAGCDVLAVLDELLILLGVPA